jgi:hypothetical protein
MAKSKWEELLPGGGNVSATRSDLLSQLVAWTTGIADTGGSAALSVGPLAGGNSGATEQLTALAAQISSLTSAQEAQISALENNTQAITQNTSSKSGSGSSVGSTVESAASSLLGGGLSGLSPLIGGLLSLFGAGSQTVAASTPFMLPSPVDSQAGVTADAPEQAVPVSYNETGQPRTQSASASPQVTIQVNAMDSQSFLDHSNDIAMAVKQAMLNSNSLNDVITNL